MDASCGGRLPTYGIFRLVRGIRFYARFPRISIPSARKLECEREEGGILDEIEPSRIVVPLFKESEVSESVTSLRGDGGLRGV